MAKSTGHQRRPTYLTKSSYVMALGCPKAVWLKFNRPEALPKINEETQHRFDEGHKVGELAKSLFKNGIDIDEIIPSKNDKISRALLAKKKPLFEAGFFHKNKRCYARADILVPVTTGVWDILEVKSSTGVKDYHIHDLSFQKYCYESAGLKIRKCNVVHINKEYVRNGEIDPREFFARTDVTENVSQLMPELPSRIKTVFDTIKLKECPEFMKGEEYHDDPDGIHADDKFCREHPDLDIFDLYRGGKKAIELFNAGILRIKDIPTDHELNDKQAIQYKTHSSNTHHIDHEEIRSFMKLLKYPLYFIDFETYNTAIPLYDGLRPYQQIPFQFSVHVMAKKAQKPKHYSFIAEGSDDPRLMFLKQLKNAVGTKGSVVVYNQVFEQTVLKHLVTEHQEYARWAHSTINRMVDLLVPFRGFAYYHPSQKGSASLKYVLPALTGVTYENFEIANGSQASLTYLFITHGSYEGEKASTKEIKETRANLEKYCGQDTEGMIKVLEKLEGFVKS